VVEWVKYRLAPTRSLLLRLVLEVAVGAFAYLAAIWLLHRERILELIQTAKNLRPRRARGTGEPGA